MSVAGALPAWTGSGWKGSVFGCLSLILLSSAPGAAQPSQELEIEADECPSRELVREQLLPLLDADSTVDQSVARERIRVRDLGEAYVIEVGSAARKADDPARDCLERARVAAVFIALNSHTPPARQPAPAPPPARSDRRQRPSRPAPIERVPIRKQGPRTGWHMWGHAAAAPAERLATFGPGLGFSVRGCSWLLAARASGLAPVELKLDGASSPSAGVSLVRIPLTVAATPLAQVGALEIGPGAGLAVDGLWFRGEGVERPESTLRLNVGGALAVEARWPVGPQWLVFWTTHAAAFPRAYRLVVEPTGALGHSPRFWVGLSLGVGWEAG